MLVIGKALRDKQQIFSAGLAIYQNNPEACDWSGLVQTFKESADKRLKHEWVTLFAWREFDLDFPANFSTISLNSTQYMLSGNSAKQTYIVKLSPIPQEATGSALLERYNL